MLQPCCYSMREDQVRHDLIGTFHRNNSDSAKLFTLFFVCQNERKSCVFPSPVIVQLERCALLCCAVLFCAVLYCAVLCFSLLFFTFVSMVI